MPQLPDPTGLSRRIPSGQRAIASADASAIGRAVQGIGQTLGAIGEQQLEKRDRYELAVAKTKWLKARTEAESELEGDKDYGTFEKRYTDNVTKRMDEIGQGITSRETREMFLQQQLQDLELGTARVKAKAWGVEVDHHRGLLTEDLADLRETALRSGSTTEAIVTMHERIDAAAEMGYLSDEDAASMRRRTAIDYAVSSIEMAPASEREALLKSPLGKVIPADKAAQIAEVAKKERIKNEAMLTTDLWMAQDLSLEQGMVEAEKIKDPDVRRATEDRFKLQYQVEKTAQQDASNDLFQEKADLIAQGQWSFDDVTPDELAVLTAAQQNSLQELYRDKVTGKKVETDIATYDHLQTLLASKQYQAARQYYLDNVHKFGAADQKAYSKITVDALSDSTEVTGFLTEKEYLKNVSNEVGIKGDNLAMLNMQLDRWYLNYVSVNAKTPDDATVRSTIDQLVLKRPESGSWDWSRDFFFEDRDAPAELLLKNEPQNNVNMVEEQFRARFDRDPTPDELMFHYFNNKRKGKFDGD